MYRAGRKPRSPHAKTLCSSLGMHACIHVRGWAYMQVCVPACMRGTAHTHAPLHETHPKQKPHTCEHQALAALGAVGHWAPTAPAPCPLYHGLALTVAAPRRGTLVPGSLHTHAGSTTLQLCTGGWRCSLLTDPSWGSRRWGQQCHCPEPAHVSASGCAQLGPGQPWAMPLPRPSSPDLPLWVQGGRSPRQASVPSPGAPGAGEGQGGRRWGSTGWETGQAGGKATALTSCCF